MMLTLILINNIIYNTDAYKDEPSGCRTTNNKYSYGNVPRSFFLMLIKIQLTQTPRLMDIMHVLGVTP